MACEKNNSQQNSGKEQRIVYLEFLRVISLFFVIFNHTGKLGFFHFAERNPNSFLFFAELLISIFCKFSVPVFLAVSGALLLNKEDSVQKWLKRIGHFAFILVFYSLIYYLYDVLTGPDPVSPGYFIRTLYSGNLKYHLWYLYLYLAYLLIIPFLRALVRNLEDRYFYYLLVLTVIFEGLLPCLEFLYKHGEITLNGDLSIAAYLGRIVVYPCLGYFMHNRLKTDEIGKKLPIVWGINLLGLTVSVLMTRYRGLYIGTFDQSVNQYFHNSFVVLNCVCVFLTAKYLWGKKKTFGNFDKFILSLGSCSFGIYLWHVFFLDSSLYYYLWNGLNAVGIGAVLVSLIMCVPVMAVSYVVTYIIRKTPYIRVIVK